MQDHVFAKEEESSPKNPCRFFVECFSIVSADSQLNVSSVTHPDWVALDIDESEVFQFVTDGPTVRAGLDVVEN